MLSQWHGVREIERKEKKNTQKQKCFQEIPSYVPNVMYESHIVVNGMPYTHKFVGKKKENCGGRLCLVLSMRETVYSCRS